MLGEIFRAGMTQGHRAIFPQKQQGHGLAHDIAAADDHRFCPGKGDARAAKQFHASRGRARQNPFFSRQQPAGVQGMKTVRVLFRQNGAQDFRLVQMPRQGQLHQHRVHGGVLIQGVNFPKDFLPGNALIQANHSGFDSRPFAGAAFIAHVDFAGRIVARQNHRQARDDSLLPQSLSAKPHFLRDFRGDGLSVDELRHGCVSSVCQIFPLREMLPRMPLTKGPAFSEENREASSTASWMITGVAAVFCIIS